MRSDHAARYHISGLKLEGDSSVTRNLAGYKEGVGARSSVVG
jgi:hypothetical protein